MRAGERGPPKKPKAKPARSGGIVLCFLFRRLDLRRRAQVEVEVAAFLPFLARLHRQRRHQPKTRAFAREDDGFTFDCELGKQNRVELRWNGSTGSEKRTGHCSGPPRYKIVAWEPWRSMP